MLDPSLEYASGVGWPLTDPGDPRPASIVPKVAVHDVDWRFARRLKPEDRKSGDVDIRAGQDPAEPGDACDVVHERHCQEGQCDVMARGRSVDRVDRRSDGPPRSALILATGRREGGCHNCYYT